MRRDRIIFIVGPTAIGKTSLSIRLAKLVRGEIVSCDSMQVYKGMALLSQAPNEKEKRTARHHMVGMISPSKEYNAAAFMKKASAVIKDIIKRKKMPIVAGGSGLYVKALVDGLFPSPKADLKFRKKMQGLVSAHGRIMLHERLARIDPASARHIHPNDARRIIRALEIHRATGRTMTELKVETRGLSGRYDIRIFGLTRPREEIYSNIESRVDRMFKDGVIDEVKKLNDEKLSKTARCVLGYKEIRRYLEGSYDLDAARPQVLMNTRRFAKRQLTWFRADKRIKWYDLSKMSQVQIARYIAKAVGEV